jgi:triosephosphate isomerase
VRNTLIAGNWKMNKDLIESVQLVQELKSQLPHLSDNVVVVLCPPFVSLATVSELLKGSAFKLGAQNMSQHDDGAYTGEISWKMLKSAGCSYVILGHSERRQYYHETDALINEKVKKALGAGLAPIVCVGETLKEREDGITSQVITSQVRGVLNGLTSNDMKNVVIAYEPVWAIGTGRNATPEQAEEVHTLIRSLLRDGFDQTVPEGVLVLYGGSVKPDNAADLLTQDDIDGALVGGACLKADSFLSIVRAVRA